MKYLNKLFFILLKFSDFSLAYIEEVNFTRLPLLSAPGSAALSTPSITERDLLKPVRRDAWTVM